MEFASKICVPISMFSGFQVLIEGLVRVSDLHMQIQEMIRALDGCMLKRLEVAVLCFSIHESSKMMSDIAIHIIEHGYA
ncbi:hypothetical protein L1987_48772 [Smallanthus sonchifolius]|uniref:Uncharacterized protein n=1 Tax=Smallanthus sonchifolius TaxID=185202 RepID=A0ACB9FSW8_9ASTR|nr:hypothetical protein L1987_48772 [Smallanthus sonchifolius]